ncbi:hypothetical protein AB5I41_12865 [Sphingomonas sp. MMS24-JH45]
MAVAVALEGDLGRLVAPDAGFRRPDREAPTRHVDMGQLLAAAPQTLAGFCDAAQP